MQPLYALDQHGYHLKVKLTGDKLHDWEHLKRTNKDPMTSLQPLYPLTNGDNKSAVDGKNWETNDFTLDDYVECPNLTFSCDDRGCTRIDLGRYAPFLRADRKNQTCFDIKNFVFSNEPAEWTFEGKCF
mmetsp:Transcript_27064/g.50701  ORF Transcript_27064/g.50701 Transcript_27064/m.50701 type:complete len:129 (+) Transcript_27064:1139-1525(+)